MNKSFVWGIFIASITWSISLYLFWTLTTNPALQNGLTNSPSAANSPNNGFNNQNFLQKSKAKNFFDTPNHIFMDKYEQYKKERKFRKISHKLIDEMKPIMNGNGTDEFGMVRNSEEQFMRDVGFKKHAFNVLVSTKIGLNRAIPDTRHAL
jgi:polypeptide N-acetylgalactosaminyltransferase